MKKILKLVFLLYAFSNIKAQTPPMGDSTFYYNSAGQKEWFYYQRDVCFVRLTGGAAYTGGSQSGMITGVEYLVDDPDSLNLIEFDTSATNFQLNAEALYLSGYSGFEYGFLAVTRDKYDCRTHNKWYRPSDRIIVIFRDANITAADLTAFMTRNELTLVKAPDPSLPSATNNWAYIFRLHPDSRFLPFDAAANIWLNEQTVLTHCEPDVYYFKPPTDEDDAQDGTNEGVPIEYEETGIDCESSPEMNANVGTSTPDALWHIRNNGGGIRINPNTSLGMGGIADSDADICECWADGYHGEGIKVAVCDFYGYDFTHPDMTGQFLNGFDFVNNSSFNTTHYTSATSSSSHGMEVASVIAALANTGANTKAVGVAYNSKIIPYIVGGANGEVISAIQQAVLDGADVFNMSFGTQNSAPTSVASAFFTQITNATQVGRNGKGIVFVGSTGNSNAQGRFFPAMDVDVIGVGAITPDDYRASPGQWFWTGGSNWYIVTNNNLRYDVVAPGTAIMVATTQNPGSSAVQTNIIKNGTSFAAPIVSGVAAIILSKYPSLGFQNVINIIDGNADKVRSGVTYGYTNGFVQGNGYSDEMFFGRLNCYNSLQNPTTNIKENTSIEEGIKLGYLSNNEALLLFNKGTNDKGSIVKIYDISGRIIERITLDSGKNTYTLNTTKYTAGVYVINVTTNKNTQATFKYIK
jgi:hypothetical protein